MTFYGISYLKSQNGVNQIVTIAVIVISFIALALFLMLYLRHRQSKYRDFAVIALLLVILSTGYGYVHYRQNETASAKATQMVDFVQSVAKDRHVSTEDVLVNSRYLNNDVIVKIKDDYYTVTLNTDYTVYTLTPAHTLGDIQVKQ
ncbi:DUF3290 domain-containing protein [Bifidobacterium bombi]|uniref:DUF3290 domain-containing protein n=1 Tax=Bifidobacterium bombi DSM 19703 TaxID=1341695 RepID=A0A086BNU3_9BIFI|nr:DUF3290 domain-containing protein [Bifidobacterium bombi]KFF30607.1 hypothetical protein BBOMB_1470 [Bifidobacterium bombi DSM 19703]